MPHYRIELFGSFRAYRDQEPVDLLPSRRCEELLTYLLLYEESTHPRNRLAQLFWGEQPDDRAAALLRQNLYLLQNWLNDELQCPDLLEVDRRTVTVRRELVEIDVLQFEQAYAASEAHRHRRLEHCRECIERLSTVAPQSTAGLMRHGSRAAADEYLQWLDLRFARVHQTIGRLYEARWQMAYRHGQHDEAVQAARIWLDLDPWHEPAQRALIAALARAGQRAEALRQFQQSRMLLKTELDIDVEPTTLLLVERIRTNAPLDEAPPTGLLSGPKRLFGRNGELTLLRGLLNSGEHRLLTLVGIGGVGKTTLAQAVAADMQHDFAHGSLFIALEHAADGNDLLQCLSTALGLRLKSAGGALQQICRSVADREMLLVFDNVEQISDAGELINGILGNTPNTMILVTARRPLRLRQETLIRLDGLHDDAGGDSAAVELFLARAEQHDRRRDWQRELPAIAAICRLCGNLPLAIELAAYQARYRTCSDIADELSTRFTLLQADLHDLPLRQRTVISVLEASWSYLTADEQPLLSALSLFRAPFSLAAGRAVLTAVADPAQAEQAIEHAVDLGLLRRTTDEGFSVHPLVQQFLERRSSGFRVQLQAAGARYRTVLLQQVIDSGMQVMNERSRDWGRRHAVLRDDFIHAWRMALDAGDHELLRQAALPLSIFAALGGWAVRCDDLLAETLQAAPFRQPGAARRRLLGVRINLLQEHEDPRRITAALDELLQEPLSRPLTAEQALAARIRVRLLLQAGRHADVPTWLELSSGFSADAGFNVLPAVPYSLIGRHALATGDDRRAEQALQQALQQARRDDDQRLELSVVHELALLPARRGDIPGSVRLLEEAVTAARRLNDTVMLSALLTNLGNARCAAGGDLDRALAELQEAAETAGRSGHAGHLRPAVSGLAKIMQRLGRHERAVGYLQQRLQLDSDLGFLPDSAEAVVDYVESLHRLARHAAIGPLLKFIADTPDLPEALRARADAVHRQLYGQALAPADPAAEHGPELLRLLL